MIDRTDRRGVRWKIVFGILLFLTAALVCFIFYNSLLDRGLKISTVEGVHTILRPALQMAVKDNIIRNNPADGVMATLKLNRCETAGIRHALSVEEEQEFLGCLDKPEYFRWKPLFVVMFGTGCRVGEIIGLRWEDLNYAENEISINHSVTYYPKHDNSYKCQYEVGLPKTEAGIRTIPMLDKVREALRLEEKNQREFGYYNMVELDGMSGFIFCNRFGKMHNPSTINRQIERIVENHNAEEEVKARREGREAVIIPHFSCHITRHTFCTRLCENETNIKVIQEVMGHKDVRTTLDIYAEVSNFKKQAVFKELNDGGVV